MKKWLRILGVLLTVIILASSVVTWAVSSDNSAKNSGNFDVSYDVAMQDNKPFVVMFHAPWCGYCRKFEPVFKKLAKEYSGKYNFVLINGEESQNYMKMQDFVVGGYPTLYIVDPSIDNRICLNNTMYGDVNLIKAELNRYLRIRALIKTN